MLILIAGASGTMGRLLAEHALREGHSVRGFGRSPSKVPSELLDRFESFVQTEDYTSQEALDRAVSGEVNAVICCYTSNAEAILDAQLPLLRAVERAGIKVYHAHSWNADWTKVEFGAWEHYDAYLAFHRQVQLTSAVKPVYVFTGIFGEYAMSQFAGIAHLQKKDGERVLAYWGDGTAKWDFTYYEDAARFSINLITTNKDVLAGDGGYFRIRSGEASALDLVDAFRKVHDHEVTAKSLGGIEEVQKLYKQGKETYGLRQYIMYSGHYLQATNILGTWKMDDAVTVGESDAVERLFEKQIVFPE